MPFNFNFDPFETATKKKKTPLETALSPTEMPNPTDASSVKASQSAQRVVKKRKGRASTILTGRPGQGGISSPVTALGGNSILGDPGFLGKIILPPGWKIPGAARRGPLRR